MHDFLKSLTYGRVVIVQPAGTVRLFFNASDDRKQAIFPEVFQNLPNGIKERHCYEEADAFVGVVKCGRDHGALGGRTFEFKSEDFCDLNNHLDGMRKVGTRLLPRASRLTEQMREWDGQLDGKPRMLSGELVFGRAQDGRFVEWFLASEQFLRFYNIMLYGPTPHNGLDTIESITNGNSRLIVNTRKKYEIAGLPLPPYNALRYERASREFLHVYLPPILLFGFGKYFGDYTPRVRDRPIAWDVPVVIKKQPPIVVPHHSPPWSTSRAGGLSIDEWIAAPPVERTVDASTVDRRSPPWYGRLRSSFVTM